MGLPKRMSTVGTIIAAASVLSLASDSSQRSKPFLTGCRSPEQETFSCWWNPGTYRNLSGTPAFKVLYSKSGCQELRECPDYITSGENSCFFNKTYTSIWTGYCLLIEVTTERGTVWSEPYSFNILDILQPEPPILLNWALLNASDSVHYADIIINWAPPTSADVGSGWISLQYQVRFRSSSVPKWKMGSLVQQCSYPLYALETGQEYEAQVRCKPRSEGKFSPFSESLHFLLPHRKRASAIPAPVVLFPLAVLLILVLLYMLCSMTQIKDVLLPPIPVPKIAGMSIEMIQSNQLSDFGICSNSLSVKLSPNLSEKWEEFPEVCLQIDRPSEGEPESSRADPQAPRSTRASDSGCESVESVATDNGKNKPRLGLVSMDTAPSHMGPPCPGRGRSVGTREQRAPQAPQPVLTKSLAASDTSQESPRQHSQLLLSLGTLHDKGQTGKALLLGKDRGFYSYVKDVAPQSSTTELANSSATQGATGTNKQGYRHAVSEYLKGSPSEGTPLPDHMDIYVTM
ncbi:growth hormone receptor-like isoform X1 [Anguilla anguilla]|uniref:growth hormone receptor-like isoform X1 n=1 Tax=Anguilla anguilla TaxID=7936 RepID=UPI0015AA4C60|nr:growth hormone receptor-like isoform X1 [Anguilla anguilla]